MEANQVFEKGNNGNGKRPKADWSNEKNSEIFLTVCIEQVRAGNRPHAHFNKVGWANVINNFNEQTGLSYEYKQMKNKWDILKKEWQLWEKLKGKETGVGWDHVSRTVTASDEWWQAKIQEYPEAAKFKGKGLKYLPEMEILFKDIVATGNGKFAPSEDLEQGKRIEVGEGIDTPSYEDIDVEELDAQGLETSPSLQRQKRKRDGKNNKRGVGSRMCDQFDRIIESLSSDKGKTTRYHLPHFRLGPRARGKNEVFNYMHSSLRSTIERSFGCCKAKWKILGSMPPFSLDTTNKIIVACITLHNFIRRNDIYDAEFRMFDENVVLEDTVEAQDSITQDITWEEPNQGSTRQMERVRNIIRDRIPRNM